MIINGVKTYHTVWAESGPFEDPNGLWKVLKHIKDNKPGFGQWWTKEAPDGRYAFYDLTETNVEVPFPDE